MSKTEKVSVRKAVNLTADALLIETAKAMGLNLSQLFQETLERAVSAERKRQWVEENSEAIASYNRFIDENGVFSDGLRAF